MRVLWLTAVVLLIDQATKAWVVKTMAEGESIPVVGEWLRWTSARNPGVAFSLFDNLPWAVVAVTTLLTIGLAVYLWSMRRAPTAYRAGLALVLGGALGNVIDRITYGRLYEGRGWFEGHVVDFIHINVYHGWADLPLLGRTYLSLFPIWNVADMAIFLGVGIVLVWSLRNGEPHAAASPGSSAETADSPDVPLSETPGGAADGAVGPRPPSAVGA